MSRLIVLILSLFLFACENQNEEHKSATLGKSSEHAQIMHQTDTLNNPNQFLGEVYSEESISGNRVYASLHNSERDSKWISNNILIILFLAASIIMVVIKINYDKRYFNILSVNKIFTIRLNEGDQSRARIMDRDNLVFSGLYVFLASGLIYFLSVAQNEVFLGVEANGLVAFLKILLVVSISLIAKIILVAVASNLFGNSKIPAFYLKEMLNINLFFIVILFFSSILILLFSGAIPAFWFDLTVYGILFLYITRSILLYFKILKLSGFTNLYLFSYFCTTEIFPFLIGLKYFRRENGSK